MVQNALDILRGAVMIVYPMNLPPHDVIRHELENTEDLSGMQASLEVRVCESIIKKSLWMEIFQSYCSFVCNTVTIKSFKIGMSLGGFSLGSNEV